MFGIFGASREVKEHCTMLMQFMEMVSQGYHRMGDDFAFTLLEASELTAECHENTIAGRRNKGFRLQQPLNEFFGNLEEDIDGSLNLSIHGGGRYIGFMVLSSGLSGALVVAATDRITKKATTRAMWLMSQFVSFGATDVSRGLMW